ncbi:class I SAM-dependent methyltransferase [Natrinema sp. SYSU A 869]|uniref:class I SAM-dependent methyltransferase n=1 Tax=Natrinema sp. SYSU A 869 TaxID=2871694 RepID=UPI002105A295|nr:class I SAM-dependent methyltransferase [Natrinema sp. SYSU A 869]
MLAVITGLAIGQSERRTRRSTAIAVALVLFLWGAATIRSTATSLLSPPPWVLDREKYDALAAEIPLSESERMLDVGCGTGRSLVGLAPAIPERCSLLAVDVFDDRIILGNGPQLASRNARLAGVDVAPIRGDAARIPLKEDTVDTVTLCRVLHDLSATDAREALTEAHRVCTPGGTVGVLALPYPHEEDASPAAYWRKLVTEAGLTVSTIIERDDGYVIVIGTVPERPNSPLEKRA